MAKKHPSRAERKARRMAENEELAKEARFWAKVKSPLSQLDSSARGVNKAATRGMKRS
ncbi:hypothetical protein [Alsobacter soli]|uniref:hypothetical protein n=1 Tax=Alsobacter soli TaxID=2109933 RepID=UPI0013047FF1|nr:hypothetical protein [Alsobacter soli]